MRRENDLKATQKGHESVDYRLGMEKRNGYFLKSKKAERIDLIYLTPLEINRSVFPPFFITTSSVNRFAVSGGITDLKKCVKMP